MSSAPTLPADRKDRVRQAPALDPALLDELVARALAEDVGDGDATAAVTVDPAARATARIRQKAPGVLYGLDLAERAFRAVDPGARIERLAQEGVWREDGPVLEVEGNARALLTAERTALNFLGRLSGVATLTARCVSALEGTGARVLDTRKTTPGLRMVEKAAVHAGGGVNHRIGLWDEILIKENHAAAAGGVGEAVRRARAARPDLPIEVEVTDLAELEEALAAGARRVMLDNMDLATMRRAVEITAGKASLEASGGVTLDALRAIGATGVDFISVGALTHSAPALDLSLLLESP
ncbi:carboxylating nicotinate-nucleotide diphosphorylase [Conexibacter stalactiti]|uniref:nicotinate-nucleotide diphosphorylase (carboxylating) n=1 Tax=Conexibacter stalactiti TaxID=1940611 RepID=A0ABU4HRB9_9ACTN|nr:carboxylating nicotinate-nucleotide diphosphorylase [Conexibacter stalactiti]MDW5595252.1 carboxylating nicotinate-nucleotide diphosphorylase [Conexibacter stalactiti]MEC5035894.1 carboxylating nicotinate-nucleotide diphosphorylase [Conexibacter stalactiti]